MEGFEKVRKLGYNVNCRSEIAEKLRIMCEGMHDQKKTRWRKMTWWQKGDGLMV